MEQITDLLSCLTTQQTKVLKTYLNAFARRGAAGTKLRKLLDIVLTRKNVSLEQCAYLLYGTSTLSTTQKLVQRLHGKILDSLLIDINTERLAYTAEHKYFILVRIKKQLLQYYVLSTTSSGRKLGQSLLRKVYTIASKYEFYSTIQEVLPLLKAYSTGKTKVSKYQYWDLRMRKNDKAKEAYYRAFDLYNRYQEMHSYSGKLSKAKHLDFLKSSIQTLKNDYLETGSATCGYFMGILETAYCEQNGQFEKAIVTCKKLIQLLESNVSIRLSSRLASQYSNIAVMEFQLGHLHEALRYNELALTYTTKGSNDEIYQLAQQVEITYYLQMYERACNANRRILNMTKLVGELEYAIAKVFDAVINFKEGNFKQALEILSQKFALSTDKSGWELSVRVLRIITLIEMGKLEESETALNNINRFAQRHGKSSDITKRDKEIIRFLNEWSKSSFSLQDYSERTAVLAKKLSVSPDTEWKYGTPELIPIDDWFLNKIKKKRGPKAGKKTKSNA